MKRLRNLTPLCLKMNQERTERKYFSIIFSFLTLFCHGQDDKFLPAEIKGIEVIRHSHYIIGYSEDHEQALWVAYELTPDELHGPVKRTEDFREDLLVSTGSASLSDYKGSGYDRGHLAPAADMAFSTRAMSESFYLSNMSPQQPSFNRGIWKKLESQVREWATLKSGLYIVTGAIFFDDASVVIGPNEVVVPDKYYKVLYAENQRQMIGFILDNSRSSEPLTAFAVTVDDVEKITGLDFFSKEEDFLEGVFLYSDWPLQETSKGASIIKKSSTSQQCKGIAKSTGKRCRKMTLNEIGYCHYHTNQAVNTTDK